MDDRRMRGEMSEQEVDMEDEKMYLCAYTFKYVCAREREREGE